MKPAADGNIHLKAGLRAGIGKKRENRKLTDQQSPPRAGSGPGAEAARAFFPRGLFQPKGSFRFSLDALLLASFLRPAGSGRGERLLDLGTGCGVVALGMLCRYPELEAVGLDMLPELAEAARLNAARLGFAGRFTAFAHDVALPESPVPGPFSLVLANPPYRQPGRGRLPAGPLRRAALFEREGGLGVFCRAAERAMAPDGRFGLLFPAARMEELLSGLAGAGLKGVRLLPVHARANEPARVVLVEAVKNSFIPIWEKSGRFFSSINSNTAHDAPLELYEGQGTAARLTKQALDFCPFLACNTRHE